jgi:YVTN family beta-propeller protein
MAHGRHRRIVESGKLRWVAVTAVVAVGLAFVLPEVAEEALADRDDYAASAASPLVVPPPDSPQVGAPASHPVPRPDRSRSVDGPNLYAADAPGDFSPAVAGLRPRVYVPNTLDGTVDVIDPRTYKVVRRLRVGGQPHHITPSWDLRHLYVDNPGTDRLDVIDPKTAKLGRRIRVASPYNLYFTPDGTKALVVAEYRQLIEFRNPHTWRLLKRVPIPWPGVDHMDFSANGHFLLVSCEYSGIVVRINTIRMAITGTIDVGGRPIDVKASPNGKVFYVANQGESGVTVIDPFHLRKLGFIHTGVGAHGFAVSRDTRDLYVSNRIAGTISVISFATRKVVTWRVGGSPDMLQVTPNGRQLWASNRFGDSVSVISTITGKVVHRIKVGNAPHGLAYFPQPGRFSLGHNGVYR